MSDTDRTAIQSAIRRNTAGMTGEAYQDALMSTVQHYAKNVLGLDEAAAEEAVADITSTCTRTKTARALLRYEKRG